MLFPEEGETEEPRAGMNGGDMARLAPKAGVGASTDSVNGPV